MYCPRCNQQQISEEIKYCSRCGLPLEAVAEVLARDGFFPSSADSQKKRKLITRKLGLKIALVWAVVFMFLLPLLAAVANAPGNFASGLMVFGFAGGVFISLLSWLFLSTGNSSSKREINSPKNLGAAQTPTALPPPTAQPVSSYAPPVSFWKAPNTGELAPHSVTDGTTKLFQKEE